MYIDFHDTLFLNEKIINTDVIKLICQAKNEEKKVYLISNNKKNNLTKILYKFGLTHLFDDIIHIQEIDKKTKYMKESSILIDDSLLERKEAINKKHYASSVDSMLALIRD